MSIPFDEFVKRSRVITQEEVKLKILECDKIMKTPLISEEETEQQSARKHVWERILVHVVMGRMILTDDEEHVLLIDEFGMPVIPT